MRRITFLLAACWLGACSSGLVFKTAPQTPLNSAQTLRLAGSVRPWDVYFTAVAQYDGENTRLVVLSEIGLKLLDLNVTPERTEVYYKMDKLPNAAAAAFGRFARQTLFTACPAREIVYRDGRSRAVFSASVQGDLTCY